jgi:hypothetical protein
MDSSDLDRLSPQDAAVTLRSLPRRFRTALRPADDDNFDELAERVASSGHAPIDHLVDADRTLTLLQRALEQVLHQDEPVLAPAVTDPGARDWPAARCDLDTELGHLATTANGFADAVDRVPARDWGRTGTVAGGGRSVDALALLREAIRTAVSDLRAAQRDLDEVRR